MALITSISGIRGTVGAGDKNLNPLNFANFVLAFGEKLKRDNKGRKIKVVLGRDGRISGQMFLNLAIQSLISLGIDVLNIDLASTPTVEIAVIKEGVTGGIIISASHNLKEWNALKFLNNKGEFLNEKDGEKILSLAQKKDFSFVEIDDLGKYQENFSYDNIHIEEILKLPLINKKTIEKKNLKVVLDGINSVGAIVGEKLLKKLGVKNIIIINQEVDGSFNHNPEPIDKNLQQLSLAVKKSGADIGLAVDPDVDRLAIVDEQGSFWGEEYTLVATADYIFKNYKIFQNKFKKNTVSNLSSSLALKDLAEKYQGACFFSKVGEVNVVEKSRKVRAVISGEGNGGIIYPCFHYGRDALVGIALILSYLVTENKKASEIRKDLPNYYIVKEKIKLDSKVDIKKIFDKIEKKYHNLEIIKIDGLKINFAPEKSWIHLRASNTEPIIRIYCEAPTRKQAQEKFKEISQVINSIN
jgi:phosphomannomutase